MIEYTLVRSNRKTLAIHITGAATVEVRAPMKLAKVEIDHFVASKREWIEGHLELRGQHLASRAAFALQYGDKLPLRGGEYPITARAGNRVGFDGERFYMPPDLPPEEIKRAAVQIYKMAAKGILTEKVIERAKEMGVAPSAVKVNSARTRWGSCSGKRSLNFSWRLIMADDEVIDYVVVHELAHIREMNHSARFWGDRGVRSAGLEAAARTSAGASGPPCGGGLGLMKKTITIQHTQSEQHTNGMIGSWKDWNLTDIGIEQARRIGQRLSAEIHDERYIRATPHKLWPDFWV